MAETTKPEIPEGTSPAVVTSQPEAPSDEVMARDYSPRTLPPKTLAATAKNPGLVTRLERNRPKEVRAAQQRGFRVARADELEDDHSGYVTPEGTVEDGDLIVMVASRDLVTAQKKAMRDDGAHELDERTRRTDEEGGLEDTGPNYTRPAPGMKFFSIPS